MHLADGAKVIRLDSRQENCIEHFAYRDSSHFVEKLNRYTTIEAMHLYDGRIPFSSSRLLASAFREFVRRYFLGKGYKEGVRGFSLSLLMAFYRALTFIKLWEKCKFEKESQVDIYIKMRQDIRDSWTSHSRQIDDSETSAH